MLALSFDGATMEDKATNYQLFFTNRLHCM